MSKPKAKATETETKDPAGTPPTPPTPPTEPPAPPAADPDPDVEPNTVAVDEVPDIPEQGDQSAIDAHNRHADALFEQGVEEARVEAAQKRMGDRAVKREIAAHEAEIAKARAAEEA